MYCISSDWHVWYKTKREAKRELKMFKLLGYEGLEVIKVNE